MFWLRNKKINFFGMHSYLKACVTILPKEQNQLLKFGREHPKHALIQEVLSEGVQL